MLDVFYFNVMKVYLFVNKTETFDVNIIIFYIFLNETIDICEFESWLKLRPWLNSMTQTQIMTQQKYTLSRQQLSRELPSNHSFVLNCQRRSTFFYSPTMPRTNNTPQEDQ